MRRGIKSDLTKHTWVWVSARSPKCRVSLSSFIIIWLSTVPSPTCEDKHAFQQHAWNTLLKHTTIKAMKGGLSMRSPTICPTRSVQFNQKSIVPFPFSKLTYQAEPHLSAPDPWPQTHLDRITPHPSVSCPLRMQGQNTGDRWRGLSGEPLSFFSEPYSPPRVEHAKRPSLVLSAESWALRPTAASPFRPADHAEIAKLLLCSRMLARFQFQQRFVALACHRQQWSKRKRKSTNSIGKSSFSSRSIFRIGRFALKCSRGLTDPLVTGRS